MKESQTGFTLAEVLVSAGIVGLIIAGIYMILNVWSLSCSTDFGLLDLQQSARRAVYWMVRELRETNNGSAEGNLNIVSASELTFKVPDPDDPVGRPWIGPIRYYLDIGQNRIIRQHPSEPDMILANDITSLNFCCWHGGTCDLDCSSSRLLEIRIAAKKTALKREVCFPGPCKQTPEVLKELVRLRNEYE